MFDRTKAEADQLAQAGKVREAIAKWNEFASRNPDFRPAVVASVLDRLAAQRPATDSKELAERRDKRGMQFYNETPPRLFLAKAYLEASGELFKGLRQPYPRAGQLGILDSSCSKTLSSLTATEATDRDRRASDAGAAAAALLAEKPGQENPVAETRLVEAIELAPLQFGAWLALADYYQALGRRDDARVLLRYIEKYAAAGSPDAQRASKTLRDL
jgi:tetratricopeptide (TPR) repeat protein